MQAKTGFTCGLLTLLVLGASTSVATAQTEVFGNGVIRTLHGAPDGGTLFTQIAVNAWLDEDGVAHGNVAYEGDHFKPLPADGSTNSHGGPSNPWIIDVTELYFLDDFTALVIGVVVHAPNKEDEGVGGVGFVVRDNSGTDEPDMMDHGLGLQPIDAGNYTVR